MDTFIIDFPDLHLVERQELFVFWKIDPHVFLIVVRIADISVNKCRIPCRNSLHIRRLIAVDRMDILIAFVGHIVGKLAHAVGTAAVIGQSGQKIIIYCIRGIVAYLEHIEQLEIDILLDLNFCTAA